MKYNCWILGIGLALVHGLQAQVRVELVMDQTQYLSGEPLVVGVRITNQSGQTIQFGEDNDWLRLQIETYDRKAVIKEGEVPAVTPFSVESSQMATRFVDVAPYYRLNHPGRFRVSAVIKIKQWDQTLTSPPLGFELIKGTKLWEQEFGVPVPNGTSSQPPEGRKYTLLQATYVRQMLLYVRLSNLTDTHVFRVFSITPMVSFSQPEALLDKDCNLYVLCQNGARSFKYCVVSPDGQVLSRLTYEYTNTRPALRPDGEGNIVVRGGTRRQRVDDLLPALPAPTPPRQATNATSSR